jgi:RNA polymerase sigma-70 factor (ECF subfamily)
MNVPEKSGSGYLVEEQAMLTQQTPRCVLTVVKPPAASSNDVPQISDDEMLDRLRLGDRSVGKVFYWRVRPVVARTVRRLLGRMDQEAADLVQVALMQLIETIRRYRGECPLDAWIASVSANCIYKHIRRRRLERTLFLTTLPQSDELDPRDRDALPSEVIEAREIVVRLGDHLAKINAERAWVYLLHDVEGYSLEEIAHITGTSTASAQSRLSRGRSDLRRRIAKDPTLAILLKREGSNRD